MNTHGMLVDFGRHSGILYTRVPVQYLKWMVQCGHPKADVAQAELDRRGTVTPDLDVSGHAIDSASLRIGWLWKQSSKTGEGLHAWLVRVAREAIENGDKKPDGKIVYMGIKFVFEGGAWPVLKTVMPTRRLYRANNIEFNPDGIAYSLTEDCGNE